MSTTAKAIIGIVILVALAVGGYFAFSGSSGNQNNITDNTTQPQAAGNNTPQPPGDSTQSSEGDQAAAVITYSDSGFSPSVVTVKSGSKITIKNVSSSAMQFDSDPHPIHTDDPELNEGVIEPGKSGTITVNVKGTHGYHNHLNPDQTGTIVVQ